MTAVKSALSCARGHQVPRSRAKRDGPISTELVSFMQIAKLPSGYTPQQRIPPKTHLTSSEAINNES